MRSGKAARLKRVRPGYRHSPGGSPVLVAGLHRLALLLIGRSAPTLAHIGRWTTRAALASERRREEEDLLKQAVESWGRRVRFVLRWPKRYHLIEPTGEELRAWEIARGKRAWERRSIPTGNGERVRGVRPTPALPRDERRSGWFSAAPPKEVSPRTC